MPLAIEEAISRLPQWARAKEFTVTALGGGITNNNFRIDIGKEAFVIRVPRANTKLSIIGLMQINSSPASLKIYTTHTGTND